MQAAILPFPRALPVKAERKPVDPFERLAQFAQDEAKRRQALIQPAVQRVAAGCSVRSAAEWLAGAPAWDGPSAVTLARWIRDYRTGGLIKLAPEYKGRQRAEHGWEARALELFNRPQRPAYSTVALWLRQEGHASAADHLVRRYLKAAPSHLAETGKKRLGEHYYAQNVRPYIVRDSSVLPVGFVYQGDGHCCDVYVAAPATGMPYRPELTVWLDVRSHYIVGWWLSESESAITTLYSFSHALLAQDHAPAMVHTDPGSGFTARVIADAETGFFARFSIEMIEALPGNARGKGLVEGWFRWFEERLGKRFETFCGHCRTDDDLRALTQKVKRGDLRLPSLAEYSAAIREYVRFYNHNPQDDLGNVAPAELWATLDRVPLETPASAVMRPRKTRTVRSWGVAIDNRTYRAGELQAFEGREVVVEYDLHDDSFVRVMDAKGRLVCEATLVEKAAWLPSSRIEEAQAKRLVGQQKRLQIKADEAAARARVPMSAATAVAALEALQDEAPPELPESPVVLALGQNHSFSLPPVQPAARSVKPVNETEQAAVEAAVADEQRVATSETPEQRFGRALALQARRDTGSAISEADERWLATYSRSAECEGLSTVYEAFGYLPGLDESAIHSDGHNAESPAPTGLSELLAAPQEKQS